MTKESNRIIVRHAAAGDQPAARRLFERTIADAFAREGMGDEAEEIAGEIAHKSTLLEASLEVRRKKEQRGIPTLSPTGLPVGKLVLNVESDSSNVPSKPFFLIAEQGAELIGTISFGPCGEKIRELGEGRLDKWGELGSLYVRPDQQGVGVGSTLIAAMIEELRHRGIEQFCLDSGYARAQERWVRKFGEPHIFAEDYWGKGAHHMIWTCRVEEVAGRRMEV